MSQPSPSAATPEDWQFSVACGDVSMRITLSAKWQARPFEQAVVKAFVASYNKKVAEEDAVSVAGLQKVEPTQLHQQHAAISHALPARRWRSTASSCSKR